MVWIWLFRALARLGDPVAITGLFQAALLLALGLRLADREAGPIVLLCAASPVMLLLVERGNNDGLILLLTLAGLRWSGVGAGMALGLAAGLKLYPIVAVPLAIRPPNERWRMAGLLLCAPLILWTVLQWDEIAAATPQAFWTMSFGAATTSLMLTEAIARTSFDLPPLLIAHPALIGHTTLLLAAVALWLVAQDEYIQLDELIATAPPAESRMVVGFSLIFAALFVSGSSFAYRGVFVLPILWFFYRHRACPPCRAMLALGLALLWFPWLPHGWELFNLPAFVLAIALSPMLATFRGSPGARAAVYAVRPGTSPLASPVAAWLAAFGAAAGLCVPLRAGGWPRGPGRGRRRRGDRPPHRARRRGSGPRAGPGSSPGSGSRHSPGPGRPWGS